MSDSTTLHIVAFAGSLRRASVNVGLLRAAQALAPAEVAVEIYSLAAIPLFNADLEADTPASVLDFRARLAQADAVWIATPEYNYSVPGVLKNALDWASRPAGKSPLTGKPGAILGAGGQFGTVRAQAHLRHIAAALDFRLMNKPEVLALRAWEKFDAEGHLTDEPTRKILADWVRAAIAWARLLKP